MKPIETTTAMKEIVADDEKPARHLHDSKNGTTDNLTTIRLDGQADKVDTEDDVVGRAISGVTVTPPNPPFPLSICGACRRKLARDHFDDQCGR